MWSFGIFSWRLLLSKIVLLQKEEAGKGKKISIFCGLILMAFNLYSRTNYETVYLQGDNMEDCQPQNTSGG